MKQLLLLSLLTVTSIVPLFAQPCPGDIDIIEDENLSVWDIDTNGIQIFSLAEFQGTIDIGGSVYFQDDFGFNARGLVLMAHDATGALLWSQQIPGTSFFTTKPALVASADNVYVAATSIENGNAEHHFKILEYSAPDGTPGWSNNYVIPVTSSNLPFGAQLNPHEAIINATGRIIITGAYSGSVTIGAPTLTTTAGLSETFVMAVDQVTGTDLWAVQSTSSNGRGRGWAIEELTNGDIIVGGHFTGTIDFGGTSFTATNIDVVNPYIASLSQVDGSANWVVGMDNGPTGFNNVYDIDSDDGNNIYFAGAFNDNINILGNDLISAGGTDAFVGSVDATGAFRWANQLGGISTSDEFATTVNYSINAAALYVGAQIVTDDVNYTGASMSLPPLSGHYVFAFAFDGSIDPNPGNNISAENIFGYDAIYDEGTDEFLFASLNSNNGINTRKTSWIGNRPLPVIDITLENGILDPDETLTAYDPGGGLYTYQWYRDGATIPGETAPTYIASTNGAYSVEVMAGSCPVRSDDIFLLDGTTLESDSLALVELYNNTDGANWSRRANWLVGNVNTWEEVTVNGGRVTELFLANNNLNGNFPASFGNLAALERLYFDNNNLTGTMPSTFWNLSNLREIIIHDNPNLSWTIEAGIGTMISLTNIRAFNTNLNGTLPPEIGTATSLIELDLADNQLTGSIPVEIGLLVNLDFINLANNQLTGNLPNEIGNIAALVNLIIHDNQLSGTLPTTLGNLTNLQYLDIFSNQFTGPVPTELSSTSLRGINISFNDFTGSFPDVIWQMPNLESINLGYNQNLDPNLPANLASLTQFVDIRLDKTIPIGGPFPTDFYSLTNLLGLSLGGQQFTGTLDGAGVDNWTQLDNIYLWDNKLTGDLPVEFASLTNLRALNVDYNEFENIPDFSGLASMEELSIVRNLLDFNSVIPNLGITSFNYVPQFRRPEQNLTVVEGGSITFENDYITAGNVYQWVKNYEDSTVTTLDYQINNASLSDLGGYFCIITNPAVPDLTLNSPFYNLAFEGAPKSWTVDNSPGSVADFKSFYAATYGTNDGDTLYVMGSKIPYDRGGNLFRSPRIIYGPGYFLSENPETQAVTDSAYVQNVLFRSGAEGSEVYGLVIDQVFLNNQSSAIDDTLKNVNIIGNKIRELSINDDAQNILINKNFIEQFDFASTPVANTSRSYQDIFIENNIIDTVTTALAKASAARNLMTNVEFNRNTINVFTDSISDVSLSDNIINDYQATSNTVVNTQTYAAANFINSSSTLSIDNDFQTTDPNFNAGAFSGTDDEKYVLSGLAPIPHIFTLEDIGRIRINTEAKSEVGVDITQLRYRLGEGGNIVQKGNVKRLVAGDPVQVLFRPRLGAVTPGATVDMMIWPKNSLGVRGVPLKLSFVAETTTATGNIFTADNQPVTNGDVLLFEINQEGAAFDTLATTLNNQGEFTFSNIVIGDYLAVAKANANDFPGHLPTYYEQIDLWEEADTLLIDATNPVFDITLIAEPKDPEGDAIVAGYVEEEFEEGDDNGRVMARGRVKGAGVSMRRKVRTSRPEEDFILELVEYVFTDDNGQFTFENLPADDYVINIQYPGYPMDTTSSINLTIQENIDNNFELEALVADGKISVTVLSTTGIIDDIIEKVRVYPNPTTTEGINITFTEDAKINGDITIQLYNLKGETITTKTVSKSEIAIDRTVKLPLSGASKGTYLLQLKQAANDIGTIRLIVH